MKTNFYEVSPYSDDFARMQVFAKSFAHEIHPARNLKLVGFEREGRTFGYAEISYIPVAFPAFHPQLSTPRGVAEVLHAFKSQAQINHGGDGMIAIPQASARTTFSDRMLKKIGFASMQREIYVLTNQEET